MFRRGNTTYLAKNMAGTRGVEAASLSLRHADQSITTSERASKPGAHETRLKNSNNSH